MTGYALALAAFLAAMIIAHRMKPKRTISKTGVIRFYNGRLTAVDLEHGQQPLVPTAKGVNFGRA